MQDKIPYNKLTNEIVAMKLKMPFDTKLVKYRVGPVTQSKDKAIPFFYITSRDVQKRLDDVCGAENWSHSETPYMLGTQGFVVAEISVKFPDGTVITKSGVGECTKVSPWKGASSDAFKRAAVELGIGRYLYYMPQKFLPITEGKYPTFTSDPTAIIPEYMTPSHYQDWEQQALQQLNPETDTFDMDEMNYNLHQDEEQQILQQSQAKRQQIINNLKAKK